jgi:hypothetical protein
MRQPVHGSLAAVFGDIATGRFPPADGGVTIVPAPSPRDAGVIGFTAHAVIFTGAAPAWVTAAALPGLPPLALAAGPGHAHPQIAPANAASIRAFLAAGFTPVGAEAHLTYGELGV